MKKARQPGTRGLIIILVIAVILLALAVFLLIRFVLDREDVVEPINTTMQSESVYPEVTTTIQESTEPSTAESTETITETTTVSPPTSAIVETTSETTAKMEISPAQEEILWIIYQGESLALRLFAEAFESELNESEKIQFSEIRPLLLEFWSESIIDENLAPFYEEYLDLWGYEMMYVFPLASEECLFECYTKFVSWSDEEIIVEFSILDEMTDEDYPLHIVLIPSNDTWVIHDRYSPGW